MSTRAGTGCNPNGLPTTDYLYWGLPCNTIYCSGAFSFQTTQSIENLGMTYNGSDATFAPYPDYKVYFALYQTGGDTDLHSLRARFNAPASFGYNPQYGSSASHTYTDTNWQTNSHSEIAQ